MSQDPNAGRGYNPENPQPENPYNVSPPPQDPYSTPPPQDPYNSPPSQQQSPYAPPQPGTNYGYQQGPGYATASATPLPLADALQQLPNQYIKVATKPSAQSFAEEMGKASWDITLVQILIYAVLVAILGYLSTLVTPGGIASYSSTDLSPSAIQSIVYLTSLGMLIWIPIGLFIGEGVTYLIAKVFGGTGSFLRQMYAGLLYAVPLGVIGGLIALVPVLGGLVGFALSIYGIVLRVFSLMAVHRLSGGKATAVVLLPVLILFVVVCGLGLALSAALFAALSQGS